MLIGTFKMIISYHIVTSYHIVPAGGNALCRRNLYVVEFQKSFSLRSRNCKKIYYTLLHCCIWFYNSRSRIPLMRAKRSLLRPVTREIWSRFLLPTCNRRRKKETLTLWRDVPVELTIKRSRKEITRFLLHGAFFTPKGRSASSGKPLLKSGCFISDILSIGSRNCPW